MTDKNYNQKLHGATMSILIFWNAPKTKKRFQVYVLVRVTGDNLIYTLKNNIKNYSYKRKDKENQDQNKMILTPN